MTISYGFYDFEIACRQLGDVLAGLSMFRGQSSDQIIDQIELGCNCNLVGHHGLLINQEA